MISIFSDFISTYLRFNIHGILNITAGVFDLAVGSIVLLNNPKSRMNRAFFFLTIATAIWVIFFGFESLARNIEHAFLFQKIAYAGGVPFIPVTFYYLSSIWINRKSDKWLILVQLIWAVTTMLLMVVFTKTIIGMEEYRWGRFPYILPNAKGITFSIFLVAPFLLFAFFTFLNLQAGYRTAVSPKERKQFRNFLLGFLIAYTGACDFITSFHIASYPFGYISLTIFIGIVAYTIARHQIFDINILVRRFAVILLIYAILIAILLPISSFFLSDIDSRLLPNVFGFGLVLGLFISMGPLIYASLLRHTYWLRGQSAAGLTHELKSPLSAIQSAIDVLQTHHSQPNPEKTKTFDYLHMIEKNAQRLELFVNDLLKLAKIQNEDIVLEKSRFNLGKLLQEVGDFYKLNADKKGLRLVYQLSELPEVELDRARISQVVSNLLSNAIKFSNKGDIEIKLEQKHKVIFCSVSDNGPGIAQEDLERIFNRFFQGKNVNKGSGIGLTIAKAWVEAHGGKIWAESEGEGRGTKVTFTLPSN